MSWQDCFMQLHALWKMTFEIYIALTGIWKIWIWTIIVHGTGQPMEELSEANEVLPMNRHCLKQMKFYRWIDIVWNKWSFTDEYTWYLLKMKHWLYWKGCITIVDCRHAVRMQLSISLNAKVLAPQCHDFLFIETRFKAVFLKCQ